MRLNRADKPYPAVTSCPHMWRKRPTGGKRTRVAWAACGRSIIGAVDQVPVPLDDLIGLALSLLTKCNHEASGKGQEAIDGRTSKGFQ